MMMLMMMLMMVVVMCRPSLTARLCCPREHGRVDAVDAEEGIDNHLLSNVLRRFIVTRTAGGGNLLVLLLLYKEHPHVYGNETGLQHVHDQRGQLSPEGRATPDAVVGRRDGVHLEGVTLSEGLSRGNGTEKG